MPADNTSLIFEARKQVLMAGLAVMALSFVAFVLIAVTPSLAWLAPFGIGVALIAHGWRQLRRVVLAGRWDKIEGIVESAAVGEVFVPSEYGGYMEYFPVVRFAYATPAGPFVSERFTLAEKDFRHPERERAEQLIRHYPPGASVEAYVNPSDPSVAVLRLSISPHRRSHYLACIVGGLLVTVASILLGLHGQP